jgi:hypothetical protein
MSDSTNDTDKAFEQAAAFQKIWMDTFTKMAQAGLSFSPENAPPEFLRQMRSGIFGALAKSWEEFMRSPQFLESMKTMMDNAIAFRKMSNDFLTQAHHSLQGTAQADVDNVMLALRHLETRILHCVEDLSGRMDRLEKTITGTPRNGAVGSAKATAAQKRKASKPKRATKPPKATS